MARRRYLVAYDIREDRRLRNVASCMEGYGERIQYSVSYATSPIRRPSSCVVMLRRG